MAKPILERFLLWACPAGQCRRRGCGRGQGNAPRSRVFFARPAKPSNRAFDRLRADRALGMGVVPPLGVRRDAGIGGSLHPAAPHQHLVS